MLQKLTVRKTITLPSSIVEVLEMRANKMGFKFSEFVRFILANEVKSDFEEIPLISSKSESKLLKAKQEIDKGDFDEIQTESELRGYLDSLKKDNGK